jgi:hypothetical protein
MYRGLNFNAYVQVLNVCINSFSSSNPIYGGPMEWESNLCTTLSLALMLKDLASLIHGAISLDSEKSRAILMMLLVEGTAITHISSMFVYLKV